MDKLLELFLQCPSISVDSRNILPGSLFFALKGENFDGNRFAREAISAGARYAVVDDPDLRNCPDCIWVKDALKALQQLSLDYRKLWKIPVIGITGTNGKTTTKELLSAVLSKQFKTAATQGNLNNHIGVPLTLLSVKKDDDIAVVEMGASHSGEIEFLCNLALPTMGIITNIGKGHLEGFGSYENIIRTKTALYRSVISREGVIFVNADDEVLNKGLQDDRSVYYSVYPHKGVVNGKVTAQNPYLEIELFGKRIQTKMTGSYNLYNILGAAACGLHFGITENEIMDAISNYNPDNHRSQVIKIGNDTIIADYYNANPSSMEAALQNMSQVNHEEKYAILGDMKELGEESDTEHRKVIDLCKELNIRAFFIGDHFYKAGAGQLPYFPTVEYFNDSSFPFISEKYRLILVKGSRSMHLEKLKWFADNR